MASGKKDYIVNHGGLMLMVDGKMKEVPRNSKVKLEPKNAEKMLKRKFLVNPSEAESIEVGDGDGGDEKKTTK